MVIMFVDRDLLEFFLYFLSVSYEKLYFVFEMVQVASLILDEGKQIKLLIFDKKIVIQYTVEPDTLICHLMNAYAILLVVEN